MLENIPHIPLPVCKIIHDISYMMLYDDRHDIGFFQYSGRNDHYYNGRQAPDHPSPGHHWQFSIFGMLFAQLGGMCSQLREVCQTMASISDDDPDVLDEDTDLTVLQEQVYATDSAGQSVYQETLIVSPHLHNVKELRPHVPEGPLLYKNQGGGVAELLDNEGNNLLEQGNQRMQLPYKESSQKEEIPPIPEIPNFKF